MAKKKLKFKKKSDIFAHGAVTPVYLREDEWGDEVAPIEMGSTTSGDEPVTAFSLREAKRLHTWLGHAIEYLESK